MDPTQKVDGDLAASQWDHLAGMIQTAGAQVEQITPISGLPDMVFTANAGIVNGDQFVPARMKHAERRDEAAHFSRWFAANGYRVVTGPDAKSQEGAGDALPFNGKLIVGYGQRSRRRAWKALGAQAGIAVRPARLVDPRYYHVDIAFCPLDDRTALFAPDAFNAAGRRTLTRLVPDLLPLTPEETASFCANSLVIGRTIIMPSCTARLGRLLEQRGFEVAVADVGEFLKAGGGCRCLTLALDTVLSPRAAPVYRLPDAAAR
jgi:N-dimethylarginine dimethylaminohydrolase